MAVLPDMIGIVVDDMARSLAFYRLLGLDIAEGQENEPYVEVITPNGYRLSWNSAAMMREIDPGWTPPTGSRLALAFKCDSPADVDAVYHRLVTAGFRGHKAPWDAFWGQRYATVLDPDGLGVDLFAPLSELSS
jgi:catechol 2,3-dioxygenase-like lactoylglutathione lyase family enzyme